MSDDPRLKPLIDRALPQPLLNMTAAETEEWGQEVPPRQRLNLGMCTGVGKEGVLIDDVLCCPDCASPIQDGCLTRASSREVAK